MTIAFKELAGSPLETYGPEGFRAQRVLLCAWDDRQQLVERLLGDGYALGGQGRAPYPARPDIVAMRARCEPLADDVAPQVLADLTEGLNRYRGFAKVTVEYELLAAADRADLPPIEPGTFLGYRQECRAQRMKLPAHGLLWQGEPGVPVLPEAAPSLHIPLAEHRLTWHRVIAPPWAAIRQSLGTVNDAEFLGAGVACVLLGAAAATREFVRLGPLAHVELAWRIDYLFLERAVKTPNGQIVGFNHAYRSLPADGPGWDELADAGANRPYPSADFSQLFCYPETAQ